MSDKGSSPETRARSHSRSRSPTPEPRGDDQSPRPRSRSRSTDAPKERARSSGGGSGSGNTIGNNPGNNLYVANLSLRTTEADLEELFAKFGRLQKCEVIMDPGTRMSRGFGFVTYEDVRDAEDAVNEMNGKEVQGRTIRVEHAKRTRGHERTPGKYLGPLQASSKYGNSHPRDHDRSRDRDRDRRRSRSRSRDRGGSSRRYDDRERDRSRDRGRRYDDRGDRGRDRFDDDRRARR